MRCLVLFSGSLESALAARLMVEQGVEVVGLFFRTICARREAPVELAAAIGVELSVVEPDASYCEAIRHPTLGRAKGAAACLDCRVSLLRRARERMRQHDAAFVVTGEVLGQRPKSQNRSELDAVAYHVGLEDLLVRPLSAQLLDPTRPEREGWIDRSKFHAFHGCAHQGMIELARSLSLPTIPAARPSCGLTDPALSARVFDHLQHGAANDPAEFELLTVGRHFRASERTKVVVGRNRDENERLVAMAERRGECVALVKPANFVGPVALVVGEEADSVQTFAAGLVRRFGKPTAGPAEVLWMVGGVTATVPVPTSTEGAWNEAAAIGSS